MDSVSNELNALMSATAAIIEAIDESDIDGVVAAVGCLLHQDDSLIPCDWLQALQNGIRYNDWSDASVLFTEGRFIGDSGYVLIAAPYSARRNGISDSRMSVLAGRVMPHLAIPDPATVVLDIFGQQNQRFPTVIPVEVIAARGMFGSEEGEAFIVPDGWPFPNSERGPALNDMGEQSRRFGYGRECIRRIFDTRSAEFLLSELNEPSQALAPFADFLQIRHLEYQMHDLGHACGIGLEKKLDLGLLSNPWYHAIEEWRSDAVAFQLAARLLDRDTAGRIVVSNICTRFGVDAHRKGGMECDVDVMASLLTFSSLLDGGLVDIDRHCRLTFADCSREGLLSAVQQMSMDGITLTRRELHRERPEGIWQLYGSVAVPTAARSAFRAHVLSPCAGIFKSLR